MFSTVSGHSTWENSEEWENPHENPHVAEVYLNHPKMDYQVDPDFYRVLTDTCPEKDYKKRGETVKTTVHWGQRKLLMSEIEFLTLIGKQGLHQAVVVYAGAAPGTHISYLADMFPSTHFVLVDPAPFSIRETPFIHIINDLFTNALARELRNDNKNIYFISDIRTADSFTDEEHVVEQKVAEDMQAQQMWHLLLDSKRSMLKFRLPWDGESSIYLNGDIYLPVWGPQSTTECRLITKAGDAAYSFTKYDNSKYERQLSFFNQVTRHSLFRHTVDTIQARKQGLDHCYDCKAEVEILRNYCTEIDPRPTMDSDIDARIIRMSAEMSRFISKQRTLASPNPDRVERRQVITKRQYEHGIPAHEMARKRHEEAKHGRR
jgi:hypothetical protein